MQWWLWKKHTDVYSSRLIAIELQVQIRICNNIKSLSYCVIASLFTVASPYITNMSKKLKLEEDVAVRQTAGQNTPLKESRLFMCIATFWTFGFTFWHFFSFYTEALLPSNLKLQSIHLFWNKYKTFCHFHYSRKYSHNTVMGEPDVIKILDD